MDGAFPSQKGQSFDNIPGGYGRGGPRRGFRGTSENAKTKICTRWLQGDCRFGDRCNFAHGDQELRKLPERGSENGGRFGGGRGGGRGGYPGPSYGGRGGPGRGYGGRGDEYYQEGYAQGGYGGGGYGPPGSGGYHGGPGGQPGYGPAGGAPGQGMGGPGPRGPGAGHRPGGMGEQEAWAHQNYPDVGPNGWYMYRVPETGEAYYHNFNTKVTQWDRPAEWPLA